MHHFTEAVQSILHHVAGAAVVIHGLCNPNWNQHMLAAIAVLNFVQALQKSYSLSFIPGFDFHFAMLQIVSILRAPLILCHPGTRPKTEIAAAATAWRQWINPRNLPLERSDKKGGQQRAAFALHRTTRLLSYALLIKAMNLLATTILKTFTLDDYRRCSQSSFGDMNPMRMSYDQLVIRSVMSTFWIAAAYLHLQILHCIFAIFCVCLLQTDAPNEWPPLFGNICEAYTLRRFWGRFWHRIVSPTALAWANLVWSIGLGSQPRYPRLEKAWTMFFVFLVSGISHALVGLCFGDKDSMGDLWFFLLNFLGIAFESMFRKAAKRISQWYAGPQSTCTSGAVFAFLGIVVKACGFVWVAVFFYCCASPLMCEKMYLALGGDG